MTFDEFPLPYLEERLLQLENSTSKEDKKLSLSKKKKKNLLEIIDRGLAYTDLFYPYSKAMTNIAAKVKAQIKIK